MKHVVGDLLELALGGEFDAIVHGCNCFHSMGGGIAKAIAAKFPEALAADQATPFGDRDKLGTLSRATIERGTTRFVVINAYTQFDFRGPGPHVDYDAVQHCFEKIAANFRNARIGYPRIGAGLAGGDWTTLSAQITQSLKGLDYTLVDLPT